MCGRCTDNKAPIKFLNFETARVCNACYEALKESESISRYINTLVTAPLPPPEYTDMPEQSLKFKASGSRAATTRIPTHLTEAENAEDAEMSGFLRWRVGNSKPWKRNWFRLMNHVLYTFKAPNDRVATDTTPVLGWSLKKAPPGEELGVEDPSLVFLLTHTQLKNLQFCALNESLLEKWTVALKEATTL
jgi:FYVE/RhoGEF/PH domain-containing protein 5/6